ncbi:MAG: energy-coupling factor ABC transporter ATP-binding protein [Synergistaceae bacterium]|nr:energy-coupling factor ABC transporter ATP-binding protein [Synergistaceae bacterium]
MELMPKISVQNVSFNYSEDIKILNEISLNIFAGDRVCLLGTNASGKSTLLKIMAGLLSPTNGQVLFEGYPVNKVRKGEICYVFQDAEYQIVASTVEADVAFGAENLALPQEEIEKRVTDSLSVVNLLHKRYADVECLSGGQKACLVLADALVMQPSVLLLDNVTEHLDKYGQEMVEQLLQKFNAKGVTIVSAEHSLGKIRNCDRVFILKNGSIVAEKMPDEIFEMTDLELAKLGFLQIENFFTQ